MRKWLVPVLCAVIATSGCAAAARTHRQGGAPAPAPPSGFDPAVMADYIRQLPVGSRVRVTLADGSVIHGTLMRRDTDPVVVQRRTRIPEPPMELAVKDIRALEIETGTSHPGRVVAITAAAAAGATIGVLLVLAAIFSD